MFPTTNKTNSNFTNNLVVVESKVNVEREIDLHVKTIQTLISKLSPAERQRYFNGLLAFILNGQVEITNATESKTTDTDYSNLSETDMVVLQEMSGKLQELYHLMGDTE